jgi:hypothetical protein
MAKNQGEGDRESAERYNKHTREHVAKMTPAELQPEASEQPEQEAAEARAQGAAKSRAGSQDQRDAAVFRALEKQHKS